MKKTRFKADDLVAVLLAAFFSIGCLATAHRSPRVLHQGGISIGTNYIEANNIEVDGDEPIKLLALDTRLGLGNSFDLGLMHSWDISKDNEGAYSTAWADLRWQLSNRNNAVGHPTMTIGYGAGYVYDPDAELWITSIPISIGMQGERLTPYLTYRVEYINDKFFPDSENQPRSTLSLGCEFDLDRDGKTRLGLEVGRFNSLSGGKGDDRMLFNIGLSVNSFHH